MSMLFIIGHTPYALFVIINNFIFGNEEDSDNFLADPFLRVLHRVALNTLALTHGSNIIVYYYFNKLFNSVLNGYMRKTFKFVNGK